MYDSELAGENERIPDAISEQPNDQEPRDPQRVSHVLQLPEERKKVILPWEKVHLVRPSNGLSWTLKKMKTLHHFLSLNKRIEGGVWE